MNYIFYHPLPCQLVSTIKSDLIARYSATSGVKVRLRQNSEGFASNNFHYLCPTQKFK